MPPAHVACLAMLAPVMTMDAGERIYSPGGHLLDTGDRLEQPGLVRALELLADEGAESLYRGSLADALLELMDDRGGLVTRRDLETYRAEWREPVDVAYADTHVFTRGGLSGVPETLPRLPRLHGLTEAERAVTLADVLAQPLDAAGHTTNLSVVDADGNACVVTTSLGLGSGDFVPGLDLHLNSMLGEADLIRAGLGIGERMGSMMAPTVALAPDGTLVLAAGAAGGTRLRSALLQVISALLDEGLSPAEAIERPRLHPAAGRVQLEPGFSEETVAALAAAGYEPRVWPAQHHFFGGVSVVTQTGAAGDPRRSGAAVTVP
jgi:gamma-glutamyltranspeptidase/glutathione hydrolase